jgi:hypothetical protein
MNNENAMDNSLNDSQHVNTSSTITASTVATKEEMNNGNEKFSNDKSECRNQTTNAVNNETARKMQTSPSNNNGRIMDKREYVYESDVY